MVTEPPLRHVWCELLGCGIVDLYVKAELDFFARGVEESVVQESVEASL
jgi:hypothetical protein